MSNNIRPVYYHAKLRELHKLLADALWDGDDKRAAELVREINLVQACIDNGERYEVSF